MNQAPEIIKQNNAAHEEANAQYEAYIKGGGKVITELPVKKKKKGTINMKTAKPCDEIKKLGLFDKVNYVMKKYSRLTMAEIQAYTNMDKSDIYKALRVMKEDKLVAKEKVDGVIVFYARGALCS